MQHAVVGMIVARHLHPFKSSLCPVDRLKQQQYVAGSSLKFWLRQFLFINTDGA